MRKKDAFQINLYPKPTWICRTNCTMLWITATYISEGSQLCSPRWGFLFHLGVILRLDLPVGLPQSLYTLQILTDLNYTPHLLISLSRIIRALLWRHLFFKMHNQFRNDAQINTFHVDHLYLYPYLRYKTRRKEKSTWWKCSRICFNDPHSHTLLKHKHLHK